MDHTLNDAEAVICGGSNQPGTEHKDVVEGGREVVYYTCDICGVFLPYSPLKEHHRIKRGNRQ